ncbi:hypothetical protein [Polaribacter porphyrae]|uniref:Uncharacterized protein n=1 Tax=Polaribacter porphyrae TaxID=1137780 RepID=A0A2S7WJV0_9FLAO|nr:hypothetical protein [Polaribacter porphyrae]PQJ77874.1 hypothetical protein BTO18_01150 [Polaribacter porphyrae]
MKIQEKEKYTLFTANENSFEDFYKSFEKSVKDFKNMHVVVHLSSLEGLKSDDFLVFLDISDKKKENKTSFVIINNNISIDDFPEELNIVPTEIEAEDIIDMEAMERELGF